MTDDEIVPTGLANVDLTSADLVQEALHPNLSSQQITRLACQMAMDIQEPDTLFRAAGITADQFHKYIEPLPFYKRTYETFLVEWNSPMSTQKRIAIKSAVALEEALPDLAARMIDAEEPLNQVNEVAKSFARFAGVGESADRNAGSGERFTISINLGSPDTKTLQINAERPASEPPLLDKPKGP